MIHGLSRRLLDDRLEVVEAALVEIAELLDLWSSSWRTGVPALLADEEARSFVRSILLDYIDREPKRPDAATAIWVLGKLYDNSLESYFVNLAIQYLDDDNTLSHLRQTALALDNIEAFPQLSSSGSLNETSAIRELIRDYIEKRNKPDH